MGRMNQPARALMALVMGLAMLGAAGCAGMRPNQAPPPPPGFATPTVEGNASWWVYRFRIDWPEGVPADMTVDLLLAHAVVKPNLERFAPRLSYWRFHRRAARDEAGHQFSLLFYSDPATAEALYAALDANPVLAQVQNQGLVTRIIKDDPQNPVRPGIADTSDPSWTPMLQRQWPAYIMGVSLLWLGLIDEAVAELPPEQRANDDLLAVYRAADARVTGLWFKEGQHAFLHHLNAVFGYRELLIVKPLRF
jgi:hypothetical protein